MNTLDKILDFIATRLGADYIVEQGTNGVWSYEKWNSGKYVCWARLRLENVIANTAYGNLYSSGPITESNLSYPITFVDYPTVNVQLSPTQYVGILANPSYGNSATKSQTGTYEIIRRTTLTSGGQYVFNYYVIGRWK